MIYSKNKKRIDPRYFLNETVDDVMEATSDVALTSYTRIMKRNPTALEDLAALWDTMVANPGNLSAAREKALELGLAPSLATFHARKIKDGVQYPSGEELRAQVEAPTERPAAPKEREWRTPKYGFGTVRLRTDKATGKKYIDPEHGELVHWQGTHERFN